MVASDITPILTGGIADFGTEAILVLTALVAIGIAFYVFRWGWRKVKGSHK